MPIYSFDTSVIINGRRDLLPPNVFLSPWARIEDMIANGDIRCTDVVRDELVRRDDDACSWAKAQDGLFLPLSEELQLKSAAVLGAHPRLAGKGGGRNMADPFVIGLAMTFVGGVVVTEETLSGNLDKPRIPDVCNALGVKWVNLVGFITEQGWQF